MKRRINAGIAMLVVTVGACSAEPGSPEASVREVAWVTPPVIEAVEARSGSVTVVGAASPGGRVVISDPSGSQFAVAADDEGEFRLVVPRPSRDTLFLVEVQSGQARYRAPGRLLVASAAAGPIAFVSAGAPTRRFDPAPPLGSIDSDGRTVVLSGVAAPGSTIRIEAGVVRDVVAGEDGRWTASPSALAGTVRVEGRSFQPSISGDGPEGLTFVPGGWRLRWTAADGARQVTWFPTTGTETRD